MATGTNNENVNASMTSNDVNTAAREPELVSDQQTAVSQAVDNDSVVANLKQENDSTHEISLSAPGDGVDTTLGGVEDDREELPPNEDSEPLRECLDNGRVNEPLDAAKQEPTAIEQQQTDDFSPQKLSLNSTDSLSDPGAKNDILLDQPQVIPQDSNLVSEPKSISSIASRHLSSELGRFHDLCLSFIESHQIERDGVATSTTTTKTRNDRTTDSILQFLVTDDLSSIRNTELLKVFFIDYLHLLPPNVISEILSVLIAIVKKSVFHLESARGSLFPCVSLLVSGNLSTKENLQQPASSSNQNGQNSDVTTTASNISLTKHFLREWVNLLIAHSCDVEELQSMMKMSEYDSSFLNFIQKANLKQRNSPQAFFAFPGTKGSMMSLPPFQKWPIQFGWSFSTWFFLEPKACAQPYLYNFKTGKSGLGYSAHFTGNCLVLTSIRVKGKGVQHCVAYEFPSYKWIHCAITYHNKWRASEIKVYVNGQLTANIEMPWQVQTNEIFDKCYIGGSGSITRNDRAGDLNCFCGQMSALYLFTEGLSPAQICALHRLGPSYMGQFKYSNESHVNLPPQISKTLYEERLASSLFSLFTPVAVDSGTLCIQLAPFKSSTSASAQNFFISAPHAALLGETKAITTQPICSTLQSLSCSKSLLPLLEAYSTSGNADACASLIGFLCDLLESSPNWFANEIVQNNGFVIVAHALSNNARLLLTDKLLDIFLGLTRTLLTTASSAGDSLLLKHLMNDILFNPSLWVYAETRVQIKLYNYLATEFLPGTRHGSNRYTASSSSSSTGSLPYLAYNPTSHAALGAYGQAGINSDEMSKQGAYEPSSVVADLLYGEIPRVSTVFQALHALKYYYWVDEDSNINHKARNYRLRPSREELTKIRSLILQFTRELIFRANGAPLEEVQGLLNYLSACSQPNNIVDVLDALSSLITENPTTMVIALDQKQGIKTLFTLIGACDEQVCVRALRLLSQFLSHCSYKKKQDILGPNNLLMLLCDRLRVHQPISLNIYESLIDLLIEGGHSDRCLDDKRPKILSQKTIINSTVLKVIATLIHEQKLSKSRTDTRSILTKKISNSIKSDDIRTIFISDLWNLVVNSRENRRIILQMSVWQHWLINLIDSTLTESPLVKDQILAIFRVLLYHAVRYEYGGWRVWIDTLAIIHAKVSYDEFCHHSNRDSFCDTDSGIGSKPESKATTENSNNTAAADNAATAAAATMKTKESEHLETNELGDGHRKSPRNSSDPDDSIQAKDDSKQAGVSSISEHILNQSRGIDITEDEDEEIIGEEQARFSGFDAPDAIQAGETRLKPITKQPQRQYGSETTTQLQSEQTKDEASTDSIDLAPSRAFRKAAFDDDVTTEPSSTAATNEVQRQQSLTSIPLEDSPVTATDNDDIENTVKDNEVEDEKLEETGIGDDDHTTNARLEHNVQSHKAKASPAFRIPEFKWTSVLIKLLNDLIFSIECDLYHWRCSAKLVSIDAQLFSPKTASTIGQASGGAATNASSSTPKTLIESVLQKPENQIYIINVVHLVSQLADNIIIASGGLLPLLADATGGTRGSANSPTSSNPLKPAVTSEGLTMAQANSLLYRLINMVDMVVFAASHVNLTELEADKNTTSGGILRQCLRLACTVTVKNCLILRALSGETESLVEQFVVSAIELPKDMFDSYQGCSLLSANGLFEQSALNLEDSDLIANLEYSPHQNPNTSSMPSTLPFQTTPIKDRNKLLQTIDIQRIQACIYHTGSIELRQSQFLALSSLYFISVLMVSKYRDIIEPKHKVPHKHGKQGSDRAGSPAPSSSEKRESSSSSSAGGENHQASQTTSSGPAISSIEANLLTFGKMQPNSSSTAVHLQQPSSANASLTDILTTKLQHTLDTVCPLLQRIMCDFSAFLSKTLIGSHGQDLVTKEAERTFRRANASPVEVVMLLCSQEWQNTLQKNAGLAFIELINEGRVLSHGMKDHIVRVAMEADFILSRLRADDVAKHEHFGLTCSASLSARLHEEVLINSLISSEARRDYVLYCKFKERLQNESLRNYMLDIWEDDDRRKRRYISDSWSDATQIFHSVNSDAEANNNNNNKGCDTAKNIDKADTKRILELQKTIEMGGISDHCSPSGLQSQPETAGCNESDADIYDDEHENFRDSNSPHLDSGMDRRHESKESRVTDNREPSGGHMTNTESSSIEKNQKAHDAYQQQQASIQRATNGDKDNHSDSEPGMMTTDSRTDQIWDYDECGSVNDFTSPVIFAAEASLIWSIYAIPGLLQITNHEFHFEPSQNIIEAIDALKRDHDQNDDDETSLKSLRSTNQGDTLPGSEQTSLRKIDVRALRYCDFLTCEGKIMFGDIRAIFSRHYLLQPNALEIFVAKRTSVMFAFADFGVVKRVVKYLPPVGVGIKYGIPQSRRASLMSPRQLFAASNMTQRWQKREIGNFQYLMFLNTIAGRTYQDLNQYPVFPWILTDYESEELDLNLPKNFRDLSKPIGALNSKRRAEFIDRYQNWDNPKVPAFHYGTHYSTAAFTLNWLCRLRGTYNSSYLALQDGKYEERSRLFSSIGDSWVSSLSGGHQNVKELIPEFFYLPEMFHSNLGLAEVELPPWAKTAEQFVRMHRIALESELVSCQLHQWVDLIFGYKQRGPEAVNAVNTFYYLTYQGNVNLNMMQDQSLRDAVETQIKHFGQTPSQLTTEPHPPRFSALHASPLMYSSSVDEVNKVINFPFNNPVVHISSCINDYIATSAAPLGDNTNSAGTIPGLISAASPSSVLTITSNNQYQIHKWVPDDQSGHPFTIDPQLDSQNAGSGSAGSSSRRQLIDVEDICSGITLKLDNYCNNFRTGSLPTSSPAEAAPGHQMMAQQDIVDEIQWPCAHYIVTLNGRYIIMGSFYDNSFRVFTTESGKLCQVIYGHRGSITCIARSEGNALADFYIATGGQDCALLIWTWNERYAQVEGSGVSAVHNPLPKLSICGHQSPVLSAMVCSELGLIVSGSKNLILVHTITAGENLLQINMKVPDIMERTLHESKLTQQNASEGSASILRRPQVQDKQKTILEASMLGGGSGSAYGQSNLKSQEESSVGTKSASNSSSSVSPMQLAKDERFSQLKDLCHSDYYIVSLQFARELAFIVCVALPPPRRKYKPSHDTREALPPVGRNSPALLLTFNLKGSLMDSTPIGQSSVSSPKLGDVCVLQASRDGEYLIVNDSPSTIKIYKTFGLQPLYAYNTNDIPNTLSDDHNRIKSLALLDHKYIIVGLDSGKLIVYNCDFKNL